MKANRIYLGITALLWGYLAITNAGYIIHNTLRAFGLAKTPGVVIAGTKAGYGVLIVLLIASLVLSCITKSKSHKSLVINKFWRTPLYNLKRIVIIELIVTVVYIILSIMDSHNMIKLQYGFTAYVITLATVIFTALLLHKSILLYHALQYNYDEESEDVEEFIDKHPEAIPYINPFLIPYKPDTVILPEGYDTNFFK